MISRVELSRCVVYVDRDKIKSVGPMIAFNAGMAGVISGTCQVFIEGQAAPLIVPALADEFMAAAGFDVPAKPADVRGQSKLFMPGAS